MIDSVLTHIRKLRVDLLLGFSLLGLMVNGAAFILSASIEQYEINSLLNTYFFRQVCYYFIGIMFAVFFIVIDYHRLSLIINDNL